MILILGTEREINELHKPKTTQPLNVTNIIRL